MELRWSTLAAEDLERIFRRIEKDIPTAARETVKAIYDGCLGLSRFPQLGRPGRMNGRRVGFRSVHSRLSGKRAGH